MMNVPPAPSDPVTPSEIPSRSGTPNSTITSISELSTIAIKDGHRGSVHHHSSQGPTSGSVGGFMGASSLGGPTSSSTADAERADRISRLAGLERVATARSPTPTGNLTPGAVAPPNQAYVMSTAPGGAMGSSGGIGGGGGVPFPGSGAPSGSGFSSQSPAYFDAQGQPQIGRERSTVGSASATGSVGGRTTWAGSEMGDADKMSESQDMEMDNSSVGGMSEEGAASLVGFGEGARTPARQSTSAAGGIVPAGAVLGSPGSKGGTPTAAPRDTSDARMIDGVTYDRNVVDTTTGTTSAPTGTAAEQAERIVRENMDTNSPEGVARESGPGTSGAGGELGKFSFEK